MGRVQDKVVMITGAARGQGESHTRLFVEEGAAVLMTDVLDADGEAVAAELKKAGADVEYLHMNVASEEDWEKAVTFAMKKWGRIDILLNNAGIVGSMKSVGDEELSDWTKLLGINQQGVFLGIKHVAPVMEKNGSGSIVNTCSINGSIANPGGFSYQASKGAVKMMTKAAAMEYAARGVRVNSVSPGMVLTPMAEIEGDEVIKHFSEATPMKRAAQAIEVSYAVLFLASDEASYITGTDLFVDGGFTAQ